MLMINAYPALDFICSFLLSSYHAHDTSGRLSVHYSQLEHAIDSAMRTEHDQQQQSNIFELRHILEYVTEFRSRLKQDKPTVLHIDFPLPRSWPAIFKILLEIRSGIQWDWWPLRTPAPSYSGNSQVNVFWNDVGYLLPLPFSIF